MKKVEILFLLIFVVFRGLRKEADLIGIYALIVILIFYQFIYFNIFVIQFFSLESLFNFNLNQMRFINFFSNH